MKQRTLQLPGEFLSSLRGALAWDHSGVETATLLRRLGYATGGAVEAALEHWLGAEERDAAASLPAGQFWAALDDFFQARGWGSLRYVALHPALAALDSPDWIEAEFPSSGGLPGCHLSEGLLADLLRRLAGSPVAVMEVECRARGDQHCRHLVGNEAVLGSVHREMLAGRSYAEAISRLQP